MTEPNPNPGAAAGGAGGAPPAPPADPPKPPAPPPAPPAPPPASVPGDPPPVVDAGETVTRSAMLERVDRARKTERETAKKEQDAFFMEHYGTTDRAEVAKMRADAKKLEEAAEKRKREEMTEIDRHRADLAKERKLREVAEAESAKLRRRYAHDRQDARIKGIATDHVSDGSADFATWKFAKYVSELGEEQVKAMDEKAVAKWFVTFVKDNPSHARAPGDPGKRKPATRKPLTTGPAPGGKPPPTPSGGGTGNLAGKTPRPGQPNSMNRGELRQHLKQKGLNY